jgi:hypothetical protein
MNPKIGRILLATGALAIASVIGFASDSLAQGSSPVGVIKLAEASQTEQKRTVAPKQVTPRQATPNRTVTPKREAIPNRTVTPKREATPKVVSPKEGSPRAGSGGPGLRAIGTGSTSRVSVRGQNYTVWRCRRHLEKSLFAPVRNVTILRVWEAAFPGLG